MERERSVSWSISQIRLTFPQPASDRFHDSYARDQVPP